MAIRKIIEYPEPLLRIKAKDIELFDEELKALIEDMAETMYDAPGIGLAAPQIAVSKQLIVLDMTKAGEEQHYMAMVNPQSNRPRRHPARRGRVSQRSRPDLPGEEIQKDPCQIPD